MKNEKMSGGGAVKIPVPDLKGTPFAAVKFTFCNVTPELASAWLAKNTNNRKVKHKTVDAYAMDMRNGAWMTTHQGIAFDAGENLIDGQHRLLAVVDSKRPVLLLVSTGWPAAVDMKGKTMDAVDRGLNRSLADQLHLQHGIEPRDAKQVVTICNSIAAACTGTQRVMKSTTDSILSVFGIYKKEINWVMANPIKQHGLRTITVPACTAMARALWPEKTEDFLNRLMTGENLDRSNPILHLRNWLMNYGTSSQPYDIRVVVFHHLCAFVDGKTCSNVVTNSRVSLDRVLNLSRVRVKKIQDIYNLISQEFASNIAEGKEAAKTAGEKINPLSAEALEQVKTLTATFSITDLEARIDSNAGQWLLVWRNHKWIESCGPREFRKTSLFGKTQK